MKYFLLAVMLLLCTVTAPQPVGATASVSFSGPLPPAGATYANAWAAAGPAATVKVAPPCGTGGLGKTNTTGGLVECPTGARTGTLKSADHINGDQAKAGAWAQISGGIGTASAPVNIPHKPIVFAGAAAYAKANAPSPILAIGGEKVGGNLSIMYGNLTLNGWGEPVDHLTLIIVDDLGPKQLPAILAKILDDESINSFKSEGYEIASKTTVFFSVQMLLPGSPGAKVQVGKPVLYKKMGKCQNNSSNQEGTEPCLIFAKSPSEQDFEACKPSGCVLHELKHTLKTMHETQIYIPPDDVPLQFSVHEITCVKSRKPKTPLPQNSDEICELSIHAQTEGLSSSP